MFIKVTPFEAARVLARGGLVWDGCDPYAFGVQLEAGQLRRAGKMRELRKNARFCKRYGYLYIGKKG